MYLTRDADGFCESLGRIWDWSVITSEEKSLPCWVFFIGKVIKVSFPVNESRFAGFRDWWVGVRRYNTGMLPLFVAEKLIAEKLAETM
jgi:hypothetical protein